MRKIADLQADDFFDVIYALSPVLPMIAEMEIIKNQMFPDANILALRHEMAKEQLKIAKANTEQDSNPDTPVKTKAVESATKRIAEINVELQAEIVGVFGRDISKVVPALASRQNRGAIIEVLAMLEEQPVAEILKYPAPKLLSKITSVVKDTDFTSFLSYVEPQATE